ncbi:hypothetical protein NQ317_015964 [Molorchus minor]|uniref:Alpha-macroglobulin receptor-binding domain-containing protein n=1 Tax=Molorchus minor TaxID=1323400 RepID=A0ABQ9JLG2_9CUCU|nr:hypothetical protein NQ317_015964 [Molorchus minor]
MLWWTNKENSSLTSDIEITSYVLLSLLEENTTENLANAHSVVRWLSSKYSHSGGHCGGPECPNQIFQHTKFEKKLTNKRKNLIFKSEDNLKSKKIILDDNTSNIKISVDGEGCVLAQTVHSYYLTDIPKSEAFKLAVDVEPVSTIDKCSITSVSPCLAYMGADGPANMAVMEVMLPSGYQADRASLYRLVDSEKVKMFEELKNKVNIYFTKLDKQLTCFSFNINEHSLVEARTDSIIRRILQRLD